MKPLKLKPAYKDYIWGGEKLRSIYGKNTDMTPLAESWELSCHKDGLSVIDGGEYDGKTLESYINEHKGCLGTYCKSNELPILIKLIDAQDNLSVQVHPNDEQAKEWENQNGKTEMWYVVQADKGAQMTCGVKKDITKEELQKAIAENTVEELLNTAPSRKGDVFFVEAGTVHAIGKGNVIAEIQQNSNVTYRLYDYGRVGKDGKPRELHIEKGVKASNCKKSEPREIPTCSDGTRLLGSCEYFAVKEIKLSKATTLCADEKSYHAIIVVDGETELVTENYTQKIKSGETVFIPANMGEYTLSGKATILLTTNQPDYYVGIDLGGTNIAAAVVDEYGVIYGRSTRKTNAPRPFGEIFSDMAECAKDAAKESGISFDDIKSVGIGCPGAIEKETGNVEFSNNLDFYDVPIVTHMEKLLGKKVYVENDANAAAWGEYLAGSGKGTDSMIMITLGTGVGSGIIDNGHLLTGAYGKGAEIGHMVISLNGEKCTCGRKGCFEAYASATALINQTKKAMKENPDSEMWNISKTLSKVNGKTAFAAKDKVAKEVVKNYLGYLSDGVVNVVNIFQPEVICLGGGVSNAGEKILKPIRKAIKDSSFARFGKKQTEVQIAKLGNDAGIIGAALLWKNI